MVLLFLNFFYAFWILSGVNRGLIFYVGSGIDTFSDENNFCKNFGLMVNSSCVIKLKLSLLIFSAFLSFLALTLWMPYRNLLCIFEFFSVLDTLKQFAQFLVELLFP